ncbi:MAG: YbhB/YbcL family Raf kinase inhibitor-like protein [Planctomycetota bacterium]
MPEIKVTSTAFTTGAAIPPKYTGEGEDISPPLSWSGVPDEAKEIVLICDDPDAPTAEPWVHWVVYGIPPTETGLPEGVAKTETLDNGAKQGMNTFPKLGYNGPMPPPGHGVHHYHFKVYAADAPTGLAPRATKKDVLAAIDDHVLAQGELIGTYERK